MSETSLKRTALYEDHAHLGARFVPFSGYEMPVQYSSIVQEHEAVRNHAGLFDVSHMGICYFHGDKAHEFVNSIVTRDLSSLEVGHGAYTLLCHAHGGTVDDLIIYRTLKDEVLLVFNASNKEKDFAYFKQFPHEGIKMTAPSDEWSLLALQGPKTSEILARLGFHDSWPKAFETRLTKLNNIPVTLLFTGYTGEAGCEIAVGSTFVSNLWNSILEAGKPLGLLPCGLGARDTLRLEMGYSLYGHELTDDINPVEAGLNWAIGWNKKSFIGKEALEKIRAAKQWKIVALKSPSRQAPRQGMDVQDANGNKVGSITSGSFSPTLGVGIALALVPENTQGPYSVSLRPDKVLCLETCRRPFITKEK